MAYTIDGTYAGVCDCRLLCPCPVDGLPTGPGDQCHGVLVFDVREGSLDDSIWNKPPQSTATLHTKDSSPPLNAP
jgi:hypothetical protein